MKLQGGLEHKIVRLAFALLEQRLLQLVKAEHFPEFAEKLTSAERIAAAVAVIFSEAEKLARVDLGMEPKPDLSAEPGIMLQ